MDLVEKLKVQRKEEEPAWEGTFGDYLKMAAASPEIARGSLARIYDMIISNGIEKDENGKRIYKLFSEEIFGIDEVIRNLVEEYFKPAAYRLDTRKRILLLVGPVGVGKSSIANILKRGLEEYSKKDEGALYGIEECPMNEEPLHLIPKEIRTAFEKELGIKIEGELCPYCKTLVKEKYNSKIENVRVKRVFLCEQDRCGIGTFAPSDPKSQDIAELTGSLDFSTIGTYGSESDPRAYRFDGELNKANRGLIEFQELLKCDEKFLYNLLCLSQEGNFKVGRFALISADQLCIGHTNEKDFMSFIKEKENEALASRLYTVWVPYNLKVSEEVKIYEKMISESDIKGLHFAPHTLKTAAVFSVLTRLEEPYKKGLSLIKKMRLYDGEEEDNFTCKEVEEVKSQSEHDGFIGIDPRFVVNRLCSALVNTEDSCIDPLTVLYFLRTGIENHTVISLEKKEELLNTVSLAKKEYDTLLERELREIFISIYEFEVKEVFERYIENIRVCCCQNINSEKIQLKADEEFMRFIEKELDVSEGAKKGFREEILFRYSAYEKQGKQFDFNAHKRLKEAVESLLFRQVFSGNEKQEKNFKLKNNKALFIKKMIDDYYYCSVCAPKMLGYALDLLEHTN